MTPVLSVENLSVEFKTESGVMTAVDGISFDLGRGELLALVGESGCGKSVTAMSILQLLPQPAGHITGGDIRLHGESLMSVSTQKLYTLRGRRIGMIFQEPMTALNPVLSVGDQIAEVIQIHEQGIAKDALRDRVIALLHKVGIPEPTERMMAYPHQLSGGMRQRVVIAMAIACSPDLLIADEPTTALDVTIQGQILELLRSLIRSDGMSCLFITHDLGVVAEMADRVCVMYAGRVVETAAVQDLFATPQHPYTRALLDSRPTPATIPKSKLKAIAGSVPSPHIKHIGCRFKNRCSFVQPECEVSDPAPRGAHKSACLRAAEWAETGVPR